MRKRISKACKRDRDTLCRSEAEIFPWSPEKSAGFPMATVILGSKTPNLWDRN